MTCCPESCEMRPTDKEPSVETDLDEGEHLRETPKLHTHTMPEEGDQTFVIFVDQGTETIGAGSTFSQQLAEQAAEFAPIKHFKDLIPKPYQEFRDVFSKESFDQLPPQK